MSNENDTLSSSCRTAYKAMHFKVNIFQIKHIHDTLIQIHMQKKKDSAVLISFLPSTNI